MMKCTKKSSILLFWMASRYFITYIQANVVQDIESPYNPNGNDIAGASAISTCGLIETTVDDPDWVVATSDRIFRQNICVATGNCAPTSWYDKPFEPCYPDNRWWKVSFNYELNVDKFQLYQ